MKQKTLREGAHRPVDDERRPKRSVDRTAAAWKHVAKATRRRRRILQAGFFFKNLKFHRLFAL